MRTKILFVGLGSVRKIFWIQLPIDFELEWLCPLLENVEVLNSVNAHFWVLLPFVNSIWWPNPVDSVAHQLPYACLFSISFAGTMSSPESTATPRQFCWLFAGMLVVSIMKILACSEFLPFRNKWPAMDILLLWISFGKVNWMILELINCNKLMLNQMLCN